MSKFKYLRYLAIRILSRIILPEYRFKKPTMEWWNDEPFNRYLNKFGEINGAGTDRKWMLYQLLRLLDAVPGDTAECGVYKGSSSFLICSFAQDHSEFDRAHFVFDSFEGLSDPKGADGDYWKQGDLSVFLDAVKTNLSQFSNVSFHKGWIPERFPNVADRRFAFVHIDVDLYEPTRDSIEFFYPLMNENGIILCDDYGFDTCPGATKAIDEFFADKPEKMLGLPSGGGFFIKGRATKVAFLD